LSGIACPCCSSKAAYLTEDFYKCRICQHQFRKPTSDICYKYLKNRNIEDEEYSKKVSSRIEYISSLKGQIHSLIDVGCAEGCFASEAKQYFKLSTAAGVEISQDRELAEKKLDIVFDALSKVEKTYDLVTTFHVLEHIDELEDFLKLIERISNQYLYLEVPLFSGNRKINYDRNPEHLHFFTFTSLGSLLERGAWNIYKMESGFFESARYNCCVRVLAEKKIRIKPFEEILAENCGESFRGYNESLWSEPSGNCIRTQRCWAHAQATRAF